MRKVSIIDPVFYGGKVSSSVLASVPQKTTERDQMPSEQPRPWQLITSNSTGKQSNLLRLRLCVYIYIHMHMLASTLARTCRNACTQTYTYTYIHKCMHMDACIHARYVLIRVVERSAYTSRIETPKASNVTSCLLPYLRAHVYLQHMQHIYLQGYMRSLAYSISL